MSSSPKEIRLNRRAFVKGAAVAGTAAGLAPQSIVAQADAEDANTRSAALPSSDTEAMEREAPEGYSKDQAAHYFVQQAGSDLMVDALKQLGIDYVAANPGSSFRGLQESIINYGGNSKPELLTCLHEESSVALGHGYAKAAGKPIAVMCHGTVGLQHAAMAVYNAWCDRAPVIIIAGNHLDATQRSGRVIWAHSVQDAAALVRDFTKWDDNPVSLPHFLESLVRGYKIATTPPMGPVVIVADHDLQEQEVGEQRPKIPALSPTIPPRGDDGAVREAARLLVAAEHPVLIADRMATTPAGMNHLVELAEMLQAPVIDRGGRMNFPNDHYLNQSFLNRRLIPNADVILGMEMTDFWGAVNRIRDLVHHQEVSLAKPDVKLISLGVGDLYLKSNYQNFSRYMPVDLSIAGDAETTLPAMIEEVRGSMPNRRRAQIAEREPGLRQAYSEMRERSRQEATYAWNASPVSTARLCMELWERIKDRDWSLVSETIFQSQWPQ